MSGEPDLRVDRMASEERAYRSYLETMTKERLVDLVIQYRSMIPKHRAFVHETREALARLEAAREELAP